MNTEICLKILKTIDDNNGKIDKKELYAIYPENQLHIGSLCTGNKPNIYLENNIFFLTQRGLSVLLENNITVKTKIETLPDYIRQRKTIDENKTEIQELISIEINRNDHITIKCKVHPILSQWLKSNGTIENFYQEYGSQVTENWNANKETNFINICLKDIDTNWENFSKIVCEGAPYGLNPLLIKLACASENNEYTVIYKGLISFENLKEFSNQLGYKLKSFYLNFVKPCSVKVALQFII